MSRTFVLAAIWVMITSSHAANILGNLTQPSAGNVQVSMGAWQASSIEISDGSTWKMQSVTLGLQQIVPNRFLRVYIVGESAFRPNLADVRVEFSTASTDFTTALNTNPGGETLRAGQRYWLVVGVAAEDLEESPSTGLFLWSYANNALADPGRFADWSFGTTTATAGTAGSNWEVSATTPYAFSLDAVPVRAAIQLSSWRLSHPGGATNTEEFLSSDPDGDGWVGLEDFAFDKEPSNGLSLSRNPSGIVVEFVQWVNASGLSVNLEVSSDLVSWQVHPIPSGTLINYDQERIRVAFDLPQPRFFRLIVTKS